MRTEIRIRSYYYWLYVDLHIFPYLISMFFLVSLFISWLIDYFADGEVNRGLDT